MHPKDTLASSRNSNILSCHASPSTQRAERRNLRTAHLGADFAEILQTRARSKRLCNAAAVSLQRQLFSWRQRHRGLSFSYTVKPHHSPRLHSWRGGFASLTIKCMSSSERTPRQRIIDVLLVAPLSSRRIAEIVGITERQVEEHLGHIVKTVARDRLLRFVMEPAACQDCDFVFRERERLTRPSRCPRCRSEAITEPRYRIERQNPRHN